MTTRQERLLERMRGARMHHVEDVSFGFEFELPVPEPVEPEDHTTVAESSASAPAPVAPAQSRPPPNTSAKRTRSERNAARARISPSQTARPVRSAQTSPKEPARTRVSDASAYTIQSDKAPSSSLLKKLPRRSSGVKHVSILEPDEDGGTIVSPADAPKLSSAPSSAPSSSVRPSTARRSPLARSPLVTEVSAEEVTESPKHAPGSGRRRTVDVSSALGSSVLLQHVVDDIDDPASHPPSSSPLQRIAASRSGALGVSPRNTQRRSVRLSAGSSTGSLGGHGEEDELTPDRPRKRNVEVKKARFKPNGEKRASVEAAQERAVVPMDTAGEEQVAEEIGDEEAAQRLATRKRPRRSLPSGSPGLSTAPPQAEAAGPVAKRRRKKDAVASPARQQHPKPKPPKVKPAKKQASSKKAARSSAANTQEDDEADGPAVPVTIQRFTSKVAVPNDDPDTDILGAEIPFANRSGVNAVDVLSTLCEELIDTFLEKLANNVRNAEDTATRRDQRTMLRSLEAFQEELRTRLLEHTIALDSLHALRKRVRAAQKEKLALREEILRVRAERDQVALRMDAVRIRHEAESKEALRHISLSTAMHDIDLVVEKALAAEELSAAEQKEAELANLELLISRISDQACSKSDSGGALKQIKEFNAFLERAAGILERR